MKFREQTILFYVTHSDMIIFQDHAGEVSVTRLNHAQTLCIKGLCFPPLWCPQVSSALPADDAGHLRRDPGIHPHTVIPRPTDRSEDTPLTEEVPSWEPLTSASPES